MATDREPSSACIVLVYGIPATGKTSLVKELVTRTREWKDNVHCVHVCADDFYPPDLREQQKSVTDDHFDWKSCRKSISTNIEKCLVINFSDNDSCKMTSHETDESWKEFISKMCIRNNNSVTRITESGRFLSKFTIIIVDDNLPLRSMRYEYYQIARKTSSGFCEVLVTCDLNIALLWNSQRARPIPSSTIVAMADTVEHPESSKHHWEEKSIVMNSDTWWEKGKKSWDEICSKVYQLCDRALENPVKPIAPDDFEYKEEARQITKDNLIHRVDQKLRECVSSVLCNYQGNNSESNIKQEAIIVNGIRRKLLAEYQSIELSIQQQDDIFGLMRSVEDRFMTLYFDQCN